MSAQQGNNVACDTTPTSNPNSLVCDFYLPHKRRFCKTVKKPSFRYCHTHQAELHPESCDETKRRVPCPINPNHSVYERDVKRHIHICPDRRHDARVLPYYAENCHALKGMPFLSKESLAASSTRPVVEATHNDAEDDDDVDASSSQVVEEPPKPLVRFTHRDLDPEALRALCAKVTDLFDTCIAPQVIRSHGPIVLSDGTLRTNSKHSTQHAALCTILQDRLKLIESPPVVDGHCRRRRRVFAELGAGKGGLAFAVAEQLGERQAPEQAPPLWMVVDIGGFRRKRDGCVSATDHKFHRLRINIKDLAMDQVPLLLEKQPEPVAAAGEGAPCVERSADSYSSNQMIGIGKHLCGACTDFAISCITTRLPRGDTCDALLFATCCHHLCELRHMNPLIHRTPKSTTPDPCSPSSPCGREDICVLGTSFTEAEFASVVSMTSWAVCGAHMVSTERQRIGYACKRVIDTMRCEHLRHVCGFNNVELHEYAPLDITGENVCIVAWRSA